jgi:hypothetical protein
MGSRLALRGRTMNSGAGNPVCVRLDLSILLHPSWMDQDYSFFCTSALQGMELCLVWCHFSKNKTLFFYLFGILEFGKGKGWDKWNRLTAGIGQGVFLLFCCMQLLYTTAPRSRREQWNQIKSNLLHPNFCSFFLSCIINWKR